MADGTTNEQPILAYRLPRELMAAAEVAAAREGLSRSDIARRALIRDLARSANQEAAA